MEPVQWVRSPPNREEKEKKKEKGRNVSPNLASWDTEEAPKWDTF